MDFLNAEYVASWDGYPDDELEMLEDRLSPKNQNYIEETVEQFNESEFMEHFRLINTNNN